MENSYDLKLMPSIPDTTSFSHATRVRITNSASITKCLLLNRGRRLAEREGGRRGGAGRTTVGEARRRRRGAAGLEVGIGGGAALAGGARSAHAQQGHDTQRRREGRSPRTHSRAAAPGAGGRGGLSAS